MIELPIQVRRRVAMYKGSVSMLCCNSDYIAAFEFDEEWDAYPYKTAVFRYQRSDGKGFAHNVLFDGTVCSIPMISDASVLEVGVYAGDLCTTTCAEIPCVRTALSDGCLPPEPTEDVYNRIMEMLNSMSLPGKEEVHAAVESYLTEQELLSVSQGMGNAGRVLAVDGDGMVVPSDDIASSEKLGRVKAGENVTIDEDGTLSVSVSEGNYVEITAEEAAAIWDRT